jgi:hypothetical protein
VRSGHFAPLLTRIGSSLLHIWYDLQRGAFSSGVALSFSIQPRRVPVSDTPSNPTPATPPPLRSDEEIALEMMKFVATTTGYGRTGAPGAGFQGGNASRPEEYAKHLIDLYGQCLDAIRAKR